MTDQTRMLFDRVRAHMLSQGEPAKEGDNCKFFAENGMKCAVGCLLTQEAYNDYHIYDIYDAASSELKCWEKEWGPKPEQSPQFAAVEASLGITLSPGDVHMLLNLQDIHDSADPDDWEQLLDEEKYRLRLYI